MNARSTRILLGRLLRDRRGVQLLEFAYAVPLFTLMAMTGSELANYVTTRMRMSQVALHLADHAARMGNGSQLSAKTISETNINDVFTGAGLQAGELELWKNGRVVLSNLEPVTNNNQTTYKITWQRCRGDKTSYQPKWGKVNDLKPNGMGPADRPVKAPDGGATMFVEVFYEYQPIIAGKWINTLQGNLGQMREIASMTVRDRRDLSEIYNAENAPIARCA